LDLLVRFPDRRRCRFVVATSSLDRFVGSVRGLIFRVQPNGCLVQYFTMMRASVSLCVSGLNCAMKLAKLLERVSHCFLFQKQSLIFKSHAPPRGPQPIFFSFYVARLAAFCCSESYRSFRYLRRAAISVTYFPCDADDTLWPGGVLQGIAQARGPKLKGIIFLLAASSFLFFSFLHGFLRSAPGVTGPNCCASSGSAKRF
jgi:hypothetical protein